MFVNQNDKLRFQSPPYESTRKARAALHDEGPIKQVLSQLPRPLCHPLWHGGNWIEL